MASDVHKIVAAILTAGRQPTLRGPVALSMDDWWAEYRAWLETLEKDELKGTPTGEARFD